MLCAPTDGLYDGGGGPEVHVGHPQGYDVLFITALWRNAALRLAGSFLVPLHAARAAPLCQFVEIERLFPIHLPKSI